MRIIILVLLLMASSVALAERMFDGFYASAGYTYFKNETRVFEGEAEFSEWVPKVSLGYGKSSKLIRDTNYRMYLGIDTFYIGELETFRDAQLTVGQSTIRLTNIVIDEEFSSIELDQQSTMGIGARVGILDDSGVLGGHVYIDLGYVETEVRGMGFSVFSLENVNGSPIDIGRLVVERTSVDFKGSYWGAGYELAFTKNLALRMEFHNYDYDDEEVPALLSISGVAAPISDPDASVDNRSIFFGLTGRF